MEGLNGADMSGLFYDMTGITDLLNQSDDEDDDDDDDKDNDNDNDNDNDSDNDNRRRHQEVGENGAGYKPGATGSDQRALCNVGSSGTYAGHLPRDCEQPTRPPSHRESVTDAVPTSCPSGPKSSPLQMGSNPSGKHDGPETPVPLLQPSDNSPFEVEQDWRFQGPVERPHEPLRGSILGWRGVQEEATGDEAENTSRLHITPRSRKGSLSHQPSNDSVPGKESTTADITHAQQWSGEYDSDVSSEDLDMGPDACQVYGRVSTPQPATATGAERNSEVDVQKFQHGAREGAHRQREEQSKSSKKRSRPTAPADAGSHFFAPTVETCTPRQMDVSGVAYRQSAPRRSHEQSTHNSRNAPSKAVATTLARSAPASPERADESVDQSVDQSLAAIIVHRRSAHSRSLLPPTTPSRSACDSHNIAPAGLTNDSTLVTARQTAIEGMSPPSERYREAGEQFVKRWLNL